MSTVKKATEQSGQDHKRILEILKCIYSLYGIRLRFRQPKSFKACFSAIESACKKARRNRKNCLEIVIMDAKNLSENIKEEFCIHSIPLDDEDLRKFKKVVQSFINGIKGYIQANKDLKPVGIKTVVNSTKNFMKAWNNEVRAFQGQFLQGYGIIWEVDLSISNVNEIVDIISQIQQAIECPAALSIFMDKSVRDLVQNCLKTVNTLKQTNRKG